MKKFYEEPELEILEFSHIEVVTASAVTGLNPSGEGDGEEGGWSDLW